VAVCPPKVTVKLPYTLALDSSFISVKCRNDVGGLWALAWKNLSKLEAVFEEAVRS